VIVVAVVVVALLAVALLGNDGDGSYLSADDGGIESFRKFARIHLVSTAINDRHHQISIIKTLTRSLQRAQICGT